MKKLSMDYLRMARSIARSVKARLLTDLSERISFEVKSENEKDIKATHKVDKIAYQIIKEELKNYNCDIYIESFTDELRSDADFCVFVDPVDGSLNWDRGIGDPCIALAVTEKNEGICFDDFNFAFVEGLRSGDYYYALNGKSYFHSALLDRTTEIYSKGKTKLKEACGYLKTGYSGAEEQFVESFPLFMECKDIRGIDNSGIELCELARNAADFMLEGRKLSDFFNLLAYPIVKNAGGIICDLEGNPIGQKRIKPHTQYDFIACTNQELLNEILEKLSAFKKDKKYESRQLTLDVK